MIAIYGAASKDLPAMALNESVWKSRSGRVVAIDITLCPLLELRDGLRLPGFSAAGRFTAIL